MKRGAPAEPASSWFGSENMSEAATRQSTGHGALDRLWHGFMTARVMIALMLLVMQGTAYLMGLGASLLVLDLSLIYLIATIAVRLFGRAAPPGRTFDPQWISTIAVDVVAFSALQFFQGGNISFTPLFALPILLSAVLGTLALALGTALATAPALAEMTVSPNLNGMPGLIDMPSGDAQNDATFSFSMANIGPMTRAMLLSNTVDAAEASVLRSSAR